MRKTDMENQLKWFKPDFSYLVIVGGNLHLVKKHHPVMNRRKAALLLRSLERN